MDRGLDGDDDIRSGPGNDVLFGGPGNDLMNGGQDEDYLIGGPGDDVLMGGGDFDNINAVDLQSGNDTVLSSPGSLCYGDPGDAINC
jgi:Ca2+-binding RTX toxin-like protein